MIAQRAPAPIVEEKPTPPPATEAETTKHSARSKAARVVSKPKQSGSRPRPTVAATPVQNKFDGTWTGTLPNLPFVGNVDFTFLVNGDGTSVLEKSANYGTRNRQAACDGSTMHWETPETTSSWSWSLSPNPDGQTALVTCNDPGTFGIGAYSSSTVFRRISTATITQTFSAPVTAKTSGQAPVAKPVPERPGFVYNPFDPNSKILLDVRGKPHGTKLVDPKSGKTFMVP
jgi:hypothetical protein